MDESDWRDSDSIWDRVPGADLAWRFFGYFPTLHDAEFVEICREADWLRIVFWYADLVDREGTETTEAVLLTLRWSGIRSVDLTISSSGINHLVLLEREGELVSQFDFFSGTGQVVAEKMEILDLSPILADYIQPEPRIFLR